jgi:elongation factor Ts
MEITTEIVKQLRDKTGVSIMQCKKALEETHGDVDKAVLVLLKKSAGVAEKKQGRTLGAGIVEAYIHNTQKVGTMVELLCETDFVAKGDEFKKLARDIAMQISATNPQFLKREDIDEKSATLANEMFVKEMEADSKGAGKPEGVEPVGAELASVVPEEIKAKILAGKLDAYWGERVLLEQAFIKNPDLTIRNLIDSAVQKFGEKIELSRFTRFAI